MQTKLKIQDVEGLSPSFSCYSSDSLTSKAIAKVIHEEHKSSRFDEFRDDFEFSLGISEEEKASADEEIGVKAWKAFPVFDRDLLVDREIDGSVSITSSLQKLFIDDHEESSSQSSSSEADELENIRPGTFCLWSPKAESGSSSPGAIITKCKKSSSTGSTGSKKWKIRYSFKRSNSEGNKQQEPMVLLPPNNNNYKKKMDTISPKQKRSSRKVAAGGGRFVHEQFYVQRRAENEMGKKKSYLPYRKDMFGLFANVNGMGKMLPF